MRSTFKKLFQNLTLLVERVTKKPEDCHPEEPKAVPSLCSGQALSETKEGSLHLLGSLQIRGFFASLALRSE